jgi:integrase
LSQRRRRKKPDRLYWRSGRAYADFRDFADVGGRQEALIPEGQSRATQDTDVASILLAARLAELQELRLLRQTTGLRRIENLSSYVERHLIQKAENEDVTDRTIETNEKHLTAALEFFGDVPLTIIRPSDVKRWMSWLKKTRQGRNGPVVAGGTLRHYINSLSNLYRAAQEDEVVSPGYNPVAAIAKKPKSAEEEPVWYEVDEAALILEAARGFKPVRSDLAYGFAYPLIATYLLSGGRRSEVLGLEVEDVSFDRQTVTFRTNEWRRLKTPKSNRVIPLWPQLAEILGVYLTAQPPAQLLFPAFVAGRERMVTELRKMLGGVAARLNWTGPPIRAQAFRNTYCAARLQTLDRGQPVSLFTVSRELGHTSTKLVERVYSHLGQIRHRADVVEYRADDFADALGERLTALRV